MPQPSMLPQRDEVDDTLMHHPLTQQVLAITKRNFRQNQRASVAHDPAVWQNIFRAAGDGTADPDMKAIRACRALIWSQSEEAIKRAEASKPSAHSDTLRLCRAAPTEVLRSDMINSPSQPSSLRCSVRIEGKDMLEAAGELCRQGHHVGVLNMANATKPGGGYVNGAGAQEENLHRRSDAVRFTVRQRKKHYPIPDDACLLSRDVTVFRGTEKDGYPFLLEPFKVNMVSCAAVLNPTLTDQRGYFSPSDQRRMRTKIRAIVAAMGKLECTAAVLSAFGCGAFRNPPEVVAQMFSEALAESHVKEVVFCIFDDHNAKLRHNPAGNLYPFRRQFSAPMEVEDGPAPGQVSGRHEEGEEEVEVLQSPGCSAPNQQQSASTNNHPGTFEEPHQP